LWCAAATTGLYHSRNCLAAADAGSQLLRRVLHSQLVCGAACGSLWSWAGAEARPALPLECGPTPQACTSAPGKTTATGGSESLLPPQTWGQQRQRRRSEDAVCLTAPVVSASVQPFAGAPQPRHLPQLRGTKVCVRRRNAAPASDAQRVGAQHRTWSCAPRCLPKCPL
jgi:hypothetical protein